jgi:mono/diheme cytochrome c family protein
MKKGLAGIAIGLCLCVGAMSGRADVNAVQTPAKPSLPRKLSDTQIFQDVRTLTPNRGVVPYDVNVPSWSDGALKRRWLILPGDGLSHDPAKDRIIVKPGLPWAFPAGSIFVNQIDWLPDQRDRSHVRRLETRVLVRDKDGGVYGVTYRWNPQGTDATLLDKDDSEILETRLADGSTRHQQYDYPAPDQCLVCHNQAAGGVLGIDYRQVNRLIQYSADEARINQVVAWNQAGMLSKSLDEPRRLDPWNLTPLPPVVPVPFWNVARLGRLTPTDDEESSIHDRARSYLEANCSSCHAPGIVNADWDARSSTPLEQQGLIGANARVPRAGATVIVKPGIPEQSLLYLRMSTVDPALKMPPIGRNTVDEAGARLLAAWIRSLAPAH